VSFGIKGLRYEPTQMSLSCRAVPRRIVFPSRALVAQAFRPAAPHALRAHTNKLRVQAPQIAGKTSLIEPDSFTSAISSNGVGCSFRITIRAPALFASGTADAIGYT
jgi:hypothetical protein